MARFECHGSRCRRAGQPGLEPHIAMQTDHQRVHGRQLVSALRSQQVARVRVHGGARVGQPCVAHEQLDRHSLACAANETARVDGVDLAVNRHTDSIDRTIHEQGMGNVPICVLALLQARIGVHFDTPAPHEQPVVRPRHHAKRLHHVSGRWCVIVARLVADAQAHGVSPLRPDTARRWPSRACCCR